MFGYFLNSSARIFLFSYRLVFKYANEILYDMVHGLSSLLDISLLLVFLTTLIRTYRLYRSLIDLVRFYYCYNMRFYFLCFLFFCLMVLAVIKRMPLLPTTSPSNDNAKNKATRFMKHRDTSTIPGRTSSSEAISDVDCKQRYFLV